MSRDDRSWERALFEVFDDLEAQAEAGFAAERALELADRSRAEYLHVTLAARLMAETGSELSVEVAGVGPLTGTLERVATGWLLLRAQRSEWIIRSAALTAVRGVGTRAVPEVAWPVAAKLRLASALRRLADDERPCVFHQVDGGRQEGVPLRVGQDFVEVQGLEARPRLALVPIPTLAAVQSR